MYHHTINIFIFGESGLLKDVIEALPRTEHLDWTVTCHKNFAPALAGQADVIIFTGPEDFRTARAGAGEGTYLVACLTAAEEDRLSAEARDALDDIWLAPLCGNQR